MVGKPKGTRSPHYAETRLELTRRAGRFLTSAPTQARSFREIAAELGVSVPTLRHYFQDREGLLSAILGLALQQGEEHLARAREPSGTLADNVRAKLHSLWLAFRSFGLENLHVLGLTEGLRGPQAGPIYLTCFLEPTLQAAESCLRAYQERGELRAEVDVRAAALQLYAPLLLLLLHQNQLGGREVRPCPVEAFLEESAEMFLRGCAP